MKKINIAKLLKNISIVVSMLISPLIVAPFTAGIFLYCNPQNAQQHILFTYILSFTCIIPFFTLLFYKYTNRISSFDVPERENRIRLLVFASIYNTIGFLIINYLNTDIILNGFLFSFSINTILICVITVYWKISGHMAALGSSVVALWLANFHYPVSMCIMLLLVSFSRFFLKVHTPQQILGGIILGMLTTYIILGFIFI